jgi:c-di-AMP phosphodiesterase-like protein
MAGKHSLASGDNLVNKKQVCSEFRIDAMLLYQKLVNKQLKALINSVVSIAVNNFLKTNRVLFRKILPVVFWPFKKVLYINTHVFK